MSIKPTTAVSAIAYLLSLEPPVELEMRSEFQLATNIAESCEDQEDGARSALAVLIVMAREVALRRYGGPSAAFTHQSIIRHNQATLAELGEFINEMQAVVDATEPHPQAGP